MGRPVFLGEEWGEGGSLEVPRGCPLHAAHETLEASSGNWGRDIKFGQPPEQDGKGLILHHREGVGRKALPTRSCQDTHV